jgi:hypothetical protein
VQDSKYFARNGERNNKTRELFKREKKKEEVKRSALAHLAGANIPPGSSSGVLKHSVKNGSKFYPKLYTML